MVKTSGDHYSICVYMYCFVSIKQFMYVDNYIKPKIQETYTW